MKLLFFVGVLLLVFLSCTRDSTTVFPTYIAAGQTDGDGLWYTPLPFPDTLYYSKYESAIRDLDINHDKVNDIEIKILYFATPGTSVYESTITPLNGAEMAATSTDSCCIDTLKLNDRIDDYLNWSTNANILYCAYGDQGTFNQRGLWEHASNCYAGIRINADNHRYYGWLHLEYSQEVIYTLMIIEYACTRSYSSD